LSWLERHFCERLSRRIKSLLGENENLRRGLRESEEEGKELWSKLQRSIEKRKLLRAKIKKLEKTIVWFEARMKTLEKALKDAMVIPEIDVDKSDLTVYRFEGNVFAGYDLRVADLEYYQLPYDKWVELLTAVQKEVKKSLISWKVNISDCDDWAAVMESTVIQLS